jgi:hypothetical protein
MHAGFFFSLSLFFSFLFSPFLLCSATSKLSIKYYVSFFFFLPETVVTEIYSVYLRNIICHFKQLHQQAAAAAGPIHDFYQTLLTIAAC